MLLRNECLSCKRVLNPWTKYEISHKPQHQNPHHYYVVRFAAAPSSARQSGTSRSAASADPPNERLRRSDSLSSAANGTRLKYRRYRDEQHNPGAAGLCARFQAGQSDALSPGIAPTSLNLIRCWATTQTKNTAPEIPSYTQ